MIQFPSLHNPVYAPLVGNMVSDVLPVWVCSNVRLLSEVHPNVHPGALAPAV